MAGKNVLIVYAHQEPKSFNAALKNQAVETLTAQGHNVKVSDLYAMNFDPRASKEHFKGTLKNPDHFDFHRENCHALASGTLPDDVKEEVDKLQWADLVIFQTPIYWIGLLAILKGWLDRCFLDSLAFTIGQKWFENGFFTNKRFVLSLTTGAPGVWYSQNGILGEISCYIWPVMYLMRHSGMQILPAQVSFCTPYVPNEVREGYLRDWETRLKNNVFEEKPLEFIPLENFDPASGLTDEYIKSREGDQFSPTVGHSLGRPLEPNSLVYSKNKEKNTQKR